MSIQRFCANAGYRKTERRTIMENDGIFLCDESRLDMLDAFYGEVTLFLERTVNYPRWAHGVYPGRESAERAIQAGVQYLCLREGRAAGAFVLSTDPQGDYSSGDWKVPLSLGEYMVIHTLAVLPAFYNRGIGGQIIRFCLEKAKAEGFSAVRLDVVPDNLPARRLYEREGFTFAGERDLKRGIPGSPIFALYEKNL